MNYKDILHQIEHSQTNTFCTLDIFLSSGTLILPKYRRGLYWLWTRLDIVVQNQIKENHKSEVPITKLVQQRSGLAHICEVKKDDFTIVYNGKGGYLNNPRSFGLRERILQELNSNDFRTGTLNICNRNFNSVDWAVSFFDFDAQENHEIVQLLQTDNAYQEYAADLEKLWRLEFGHPILCRY